MKTAFRIKLIFVTDKRSDITDEGIELPEFTVQYMEDVINNKKIDIEMIGDKWTNDIEPVIIIKEK